ncbi:MAG: hypothetical protein ACNS62_18255 [Candidatus Cyclobacteriaceae bacterium M3_2C_046]
MKKIIVVGLLMLCTTWMQAQDYQTGLGLRLGTSNGITIKHFVNSNAALEGQLTGRWRGVTITGLYVVQNPAFDTPGFSWFFGGGAHIGFYNNYRDHPWFKDDYHNDTVMGVDLILGLEYTFTEAPITLGLDWKPEVNLIGYQGFWGEEFGLSIRYNFN